MPRISGRDAIKQAVKDYGGSGFNFFSLKNDGDRATVRFLHKDDKDLDLFVVHKVEVDGKQQYIECLQNEDCPLCKAGNTPGLKVFFTMYDVAKDETVIWDRGPGIVDQILGFIDKYGYLNNRNYEIVRHGAAGSTKTTYQLFPEDKTDAVDKRGKPLGDRPDVYGKVVKVMTAEEMEKISVESTSAAERKDRATSAKRGPGF